MLCSRSSVIKLAFLISDSVHPCSSSSSSFSLSSSHDDATRIHSWNFYYYYQRHRKRACSWSCLPATNSVTTHILDALQLLCTVSGYVRPLYNSSQPQSMVKCCGMTLCTQKVIQFTDDDEGRSAFHNTNSPFTSSKLHPSLEMRPEIKAESNYYQI